jgi:hypothetical protein
MFTPGGARTQEATNVKRNLISMMMRCCCWMPASAGRDAVSKNYLLEYQWQHQKAYRGLSANGSKLCMISL